MLDLYKELILEEAKNPQNQGELKDADVVRTETNASCGDKITVYLKLIPLTAMSTRAKAKATSSESDPIVAEIKWQGAGCIISQAHMSVLSERVKGMTVSAVLALTKQDLLPLLGLETIAPGRERCLMLSLQTIQKALAQAKLN